MSRRIVTHREQVALAAQWRPELRIAAAPGPFTPTGEVLEGNSSPGVYSDPSGGRWVGKPSKYEFPAQLDAATSRLQNRVGLPAPQTHVVDVNGKPASMQQWISGSPAFPDHNVDLSQLDPKDVLELQKHMAFDWAIANHDAHSGNFLRDDATGGLVGIDKGQAFKYFGRDRLSPSFGNDVNPPLYPNSPVYSSLLSQHAQGQGQLHDPRTGELGQFINGIQSIPDDEWREHLRPYAETAHQVGKLSTGDPEAFLDAAVARKNNLSNDFGSLYDQVSARRPQVVASILRQAGVVPGKSRATTSGGRTDPQKIYRGLVVPSPVDLNGIAKAVGGNWSLDPDVAESFADPVNGWGAPEPNDDGTFPPYVGVTFSGEWDGNPSQLAPAPDGRNGDFLVDHEQEVRLSPGTPVNVNSVKLHHDYTFESPPEILDGPRQMRAAKPGWTDAEERWLAEQPQKWQDHYKEYLGDFEDDYAKLQQPGVIGLSLPETSHLFGGPASAEREPVYSPKKKNPVAPTSWQGGARPQVSQATTPVDQDILPFEEDLPRHNNDPIELWRGGTIDLTHPAAAQLSAYIFGSDDQPTPDAMEKGQLQLYAPDAIDDWDDPRAGDDPYFNIPPDYESPHIGQMALDYLANDPGSGSSLGRHWTTDEVIANNFASNPQFNLPDHGEIYLPYRIRAHWPGLGEDPNRTNTGSDYPEESEITLLPDAPVNIQDFQIWHPYKQQWQSVLSKPQARTAALVRISGRPPGYYSPNERNPLPQPGLYRDRGELTATGRPSLDWEFEDPDPDQDPLPFEEDLGREVKPQVLWRGDPIDLTDPAAAEIRAMVFGSDDQHHPFRDDSRKDGLQEQLYAPEGVMDYADYHLTYPSVKGQDGQWTDNGWAEYYKKNKRTYGEPLHDIPPVYNSPELGQKILDYLANNPRSKSNLGRHWSTSPSVANQFSTQMGDHPPTNDKHELPVRMRAHWHGLGEDPNRTNTTDAFPGEKEITLLPGAPVSIQDLEVYHPDHGWVSTGIQPHRRQAKNGGKKKEVNWDGWLEHYFEPEDLAGAESKPAPVPKKPKGPKPGFEGWLEHYSRLKTADPVFPNEDFEDDPLDDPEDHFEDDEPNPTYELYQAWKDAYDSGGAKGKFPDWFDTNEVSDDAYEAFGDWLRNVDDPEWKEWEDDPYGTAYDNAQQQFHDYLYANDVPHTKDEAKAKELEELTNEDSGQYTPDGYYIPGAGGFDPDFEDRPRLYPNDKYDERRYYSPNALNPESASMARPGIDFEEEQPSEWDEQSMLPLGENNSSDPHRGRGGWDRFREHFDPPTDPHFIDWVKENYEIDDPANHSGVGLLRQRDGYSSSDWQGVVRDYDARNPQYQWPKDRKPVDLYRGVRLNLNHPDLGELRRSLFGPRYEGDENDFGGSLKNKDLAKAHPLGFDNPELGQRILDHIEQNYGNRDFGIGRHWSTSHENATSFATGSGGGTGTGQEYGGPAPNLPVRIRGEWKGLGEDPYRTNTGGHYEDEQEITMLPGAPLNIADVEIMHPQTRQWHSVLDLPHQRTASLQRVSWPKEWVAERAERDWQRRNQTPAEQRKQHVKNIKGDPEAKNEWASRPKQNEFSSKEYLSQPTLPGMEKIRGERGRLMRGLPIDTTRPEFRKVWQMTYGQGQPVDDPGMFEDADLRYEDRGGEFDHPGLADAILEGLNTPTKDHPGGAGNHWTSDFDMASDYGFGDGPGSPRGMRAWRGIEHLPVLLDADWNGQGENFGRGGSGNVDFEKEVNLQSGAPLTLRDLRIPYSAKPWPDGGNEWNPILDKSRDITAAFED